MEIFGSKFIEGPLTFYYLKCEVGQSTSGIHLYDVSAIDQRDPKNRFCKVFPFENKYYVSYPHGYLCHNGLFVLMNFKNIPVIIKFEKE